MDLTPDAQLHLVQRLTDLLEQWGAFLFIVVLILIVYRKEIGALILSLRRESNADALMAQMNASFSQNLHYFEKAVEHTAEIKANSEELVEVAKEAVAVARALKEEMIRRSR